MSIYLAQLYIFELDDVFTRDVLQPNTLFVFYSRTCKNKDINNNTLV